MMRAALRGAALLCAVALGTALPTSGAAQDAAPDQRILVMVPVAPLHFRGASTYGGGYEDDTGRKARMRTAADIARAQQAEVLSAWTMPALAVECFVMRLPAGRPVDAAIDALSHDARVAWAQPLHAYRALEHNDPLFSLQPSARAWHLEQMHAYATGRSVSVAVIDSGVELGHPDLDGRIAVARNFVDGSDYAAERHGTAVAGIIAADADNGIGIAGVAPQANLQALRACWQTDAGATDCDSFTLAKALQFAVQNHAQVINMSLSGPEDKLLARLIDAAQFQGATVVGAFDVQAPRGGFPASHPSVIAVAADEDGASTATVSAPGRDVPATLPGARWGFVSGASFAAAQVSGALALLRELAPALAPAQARERLLSAARAAGSEDAAARPSGAHTDMCTVLAQAARACECLCTAPSRAPVVSWR